MKTITMKWALIATVSSSMLFSCKKEKSNTPECSISITNLSGSYKLTALQYKSTVTAAPVDYLASMDACEKDDIITLKSNGTYDYNDAGTVCTPKKTDHGTWKLNGSTLTSDGTLNGTIASYDCKTLIYYVENSIVAGDKLTFTMVKQ
ncbi:lipocalin-like protein [Chitinophaga niastensis]|uniref:Lipocalin-like protein n=1 Tax=Chitinophaga niastensis TaxID=536980 RepID=A0A2P8HMC2_CHINA|nr:lipocalin family protein [Chitinophaga niastensis]PSL47361.1 lipocalin-like protein [Chitinophaga niastensis]